MSELTRLWREYCRDQESAVFSKIYQLSSEVIFITAYKEMQDKWKALHITHLVLRDLKFFNFPEEKFEKLQKTESLENFLAKYIPFVCLRENL